MHLFRSPRPRDPSNSGRRIQNILSYAGDTIVGTSNGRTERGSRACRNAWINEQGSTREQDERASAPFQRDAHAPWARGEGETNEEKTERERERERMYVYMSAHRGAGQASICPRQCRLGRLGILDRYREGFPVGRGGTPLLLARGIRENPRTGELAREISHRDRSLVSLARVLSSPAHPSPLPRSLLIPRRPRIGHVQDYASTIERGRLLPPRDPPFAKEGK